MVGRLDQWLNPVHFGAMVFASLTCLIQEEVWNGHEIKFCFFRVAWELHVRRGLVGPQLFALEGWHFQG